MSLKGKKGQEEEVCFEPRFKTGDGKSVSDGRLQFLPKAIYDIDLGKYDFSKKQWCCGSTCPTLGVN
jgi:hypothetical protein